MDRSEGSAPLTIVTISLRHFRCWSILNSSDLFLFVWVGQPARRLGNIQPGVFARRFAVAVNEDLRGCRRSIC